MHLTNVMYKNLSSGNKPKENGVKKFKLSNIRPINEGDRKYHKTVTANSIQVTPCIELGSACNTICLSSTNKINLKLILMLDDYKVT